MILTLGKRLALCLILLLCCGSSSLADSPSSKIAAEAAAKAVAAQEKAAEAAAKAKEKAAAAAVRAKEEAAKAEEKAAAAAAKAKAEAAAAAAKAEAKASAASASSHAVGYINVKSDGGAKGDGATDDQSAITHGVALAIATHKPLYFPAGTYMHSDNIYVNGIAMYGAGASTTLIATTSNSGTIYLSGSGASVSTLRLCYSNPIGGPSYDTSECAIFTQSAKNFKISQVTIINSSANGIYCLQSGPGTISSVLIQAHSPNACGTFIQDCSSVSVTGCTMPDLTSWTYQAGSNYLAVESNTFTTTAITSSPVIISGLSNGTFSKNTVLGGTVYIGGAPANNQLLLGNQGPVNNLTVTANLLDGTNVPLNYQNKLGFIVNGSNYNPGVNSVTLTSNVIRNLSGAGAGITLGGSVTNATINSNTIENILGDPGFTPGIGILSYSVGNLTIENNTITNVDSTAIYIAPNTGVGVVNILSNVISNACRKNGSAIIESDNPNLCPGVIITKAAITNNFYKGSANQAKSYVVFTDPSAHVLTFSGNTQANTLLPNNIQD